MDPSEFGVGYAMRAKHPTEALTSSTATRIDVMHLIFQRTILEVAVRCAGEALLSALGQANSRAKQDAVRNRKAGSRGECGVGEAHIGAESAKRLNTHSKDQAPSRRYDEERVTRPNQYLGLRR